jgi:hypothetical protein
MPLSPALRRGAAAVAATLATAPAIAQANTFGGEALKQAWTDKELGGRTGAGGQFYMTLKADGSATFSTANLSDTGVWRATDTGYCATWRQIRQGKEGCFTVQRSGASFIVLDADGKETGRVHSVR